MNIGDIVKVYIDILLLINFFCDFLVLYSVSTILKYNIKFKRLICGALIGSLSIIVLFIKLNNILLFILKLFFGSLMILVSFGYKNIRYFIKNIIYFFLNSLLLGGFIYLINLKLKNSVINNLFGNYSLIVLFSPFIIYIYTKYLLDLKNNYSLKYKIDIYIKGQVINLCGYYDTGAVIKDPYKKRSIIIVNKESIKINNTNYLLVPCNTINKSFLMKCFKPDYVYIHGVGSIDNVLIGISPKKINIDGIDCLINKRILEEYSENYRNNKKIIKC